NGGKATGRAEDVCVGQQVALYEDPANPTKVTGYSCDGEQVDFDNEFKGEFLTYNLNLGWSYNTLNRPVFPTNGMSHRVNAVIALPCSDVEYQKLTYDAQAFLPLPYDFVLRSYGKLGYGNDLPFYKNFYAGGFRSVRGYDNSALGPKYPGVTYNES